MDWWFGTVQVRWMVHVDLWLPHGLVATWVAWYTSWLLFGYVGSWNLGWLFDWLVHSTHVVDGWVAWNLVLLDLVSAWLGQ